MTKTQEKTSLFNLLYLLPKGISDEIVRIAKSRRAGLMGVREIALRSDASCEINIMGEIVPLCSRFGDAEIESMLITLMDGALYAHRDSLASGYVCLDGGIRVGVCGSAKYDGSGLVGVGSIRSLLFRIPTGECAFREELIDTYTSGIGSGMLIYSPPGVGKTTALRALAHFASQGRESKRVVVVDERMEFPPEEFSSCRIDILRGYKRREGIEIATRTMSAELIIIDEIGAEDSSAILDVIRCGVPVIATAHASSFEEIMSKNSLKKLIECSAFDVFLGISRSSQAVKGTPKPISCRPKCFFKTSQSSPISREI